MNIWTRLFSSSVKTRLFDHLDLIARQRDLDQRRMIDLIDRQQEQHCASQRELATLIKSVADSVLEQSRSFNKYLDLVAPKGEPQVRIMNDALEAHWERELLKQRSDYSELDMVGVPVNAPAVEQLAYQDAVGADLSQFVRNL